MRQRPHSYNRTVVTVPTAGSSTTDPRSRGRTPSGKRTTVKTIRKFKADIGELEVHVSCVTLTPADAEVLLAMNTDNRNLRKAKVDEYRRSIDRGDFLFNGDAIRISVDNVLLDGQHRLEALRGSENPDAAITTLLVEGLPAVSRETIDVGALRTAANLLEFGDDRLKNAINIAALGRAAMIMESTAQSMPGKQEVVHFVHANRPELERAYLHGHRTIEAAPFKGGATPYSLAAYFIGKAEPDQELIRFFFHKLANGTGLYGGDPILTLRNRLIATPPDTLGGSRSRYMRNTSVFIRAWNAFAEGKPAKTIKSWADGQKYPEILPAVDAVRERVREEIEGNAAEFTEDGQLISLDPSIHGRGRAKSIQQERMETTTPAKRRQKAKELADQGV